MSFEGRVVKLCCGEALIDMIPFTHQSGEQLGKALGGSNVASEFAIIPDQPTTLEFVQLTGGNATCTFYDENTAGLGLDPAQLPDIPDAVSMTYFGGISWINKPCADFISDEAAYRSRLNRIIAVADILKVSDENLNWIIREPIALEDKQAQIQAMEPKLVILTREGAGASALSNEGKWIDVAAKLVEVVDRVGTGDTFNAGVLTNLCEIRQQTKGALDRIKDYCDEVALDFGARFAAITISRSGATSLAARTTCANNSI